MSCGTSGTDYCEYSSFSNLGVSVLTVGFECMSSCG